MFIILLWLCSLLSFSTSSEMENPDGKLTLPQLLNKYGYPCKIYSVVTADFYILTLHRIPHGKNTTSISRKVVFLQHGIMQSSDDWILAGPSKALAYILADQGYDVWLGNVRGNKHSRKHSYLNPDSYEYWDFSWHEIGYFDLPAMIDFILQLTGEQRLSYIGHSQGTTVFYVMASTRPDYNEKIKAQFSLAPIAYMDHMTSPLMRIMAWWRTPISVLFNIIGLREFLPSNGFLRLGESYMCKDDFELQTLCSNALFVICGFSSNQMNVSLLSVFAGHTPAGCSTKQMVHYAQLVKSGHFRPYDYGYVGNLQKYGRFLPPDYDLNKTSTPIYMFYSKNDWIASEIDVKRLFQELPNSQKIISVADNSFNHLDYLFGIDAPKLVYRRLLELLSDY